MLSAITIAAGLVLAGLVLANTPGQALLAGLVAWWAVGTPITRWAWGVFVGADKSSAWKWAWAVGLGMLWPLWALLASLALVGESRAKEH